MKKLTKKTIFNHRAIRTLNSTELQFHTKLLNTVLGQEPFSVISHLPKFVSHDDKSRPLILHIKIIEKIENDHGKIIFENVIINANDWDYVIKNVDHNPDKINLIKLIPGTNNLLTIGANRDNGFFMVTHYETQTRSPYKLKNLLQNRGDSLDNTGGAAVPSFATSSEEVASQLDLPGVSKCTDIIVEDS